MQLFLGIKPNITRLKKGVCKKPSFFSRFVIRKNLLTFFVLISAFVLFSCSGSHQSEMLFRHFLSRHTEKIKPIQLNYNKAIWDTYTGESSFTELLTETRRTDSLYNAADKSPEYYQNLLRNVYDNTSDFEILFKIKKSGLITDPLLQRQSMSFFREYLLTKHSWEETEEIQTRLFEHFFELKKQENTFFDSLKNIPQRDARLMWIEKFSNLTNEFREMIKAMNNDATKLGYDNYFHTEMDNYEVSLPELEEIIEIVKKATDADYDLLFKDCQEILSEELDISAENLSPSHFSYAYSQIAFPKLWNTEYSQQEFINKLEAFFEYGGFNINNILEQSDIWYDKDKMNNNFFLCLDFEKGDMRVYSNIKPNSNHFYFMIHEFAHALHYKNIDKEVPYFLKTPNPIIAEAIAMYFDSKIFTSPKTREILDMPSPADSPFYKHFSCPSRLVFIRKLLRNIEFEKGIFENPEQDFNALWWDLNRKYLRFDAAPEEQVPEWMSNQHVIYCNGVNVFYLYAIIITAQLEYYFPDDQIALLKNKVMKYGDSLPWKEIVKKATGEEMNMEYLLESYKKYRQPGNMTYDGLTFYPEIPVNYFFSNNQPLMLLNK